MIRLARADIGHACPAQPFAAREGDVEAMLLEHFENRFSSGTSNSTPLRSSRTVNEEDSRGSSLSGVVNHSKRTVSLGK